eukprot:TRINITY_DN514_c0_g3_i1.p2 TRINITY_DN514_c0_g3~~TRINITY_DN514_c0_g3_i1.p2  ORF type:complete len:250 (+),score=43.90 TRINITY_DN514_c0_g3_i1:46-795(+)
MAIRVSLFAVASAVVLALIVGLGSVECLPAPQDLSVAGTNATDASAFVPTKPPVVWAPAHSNNYKPANRGAPGTIKYVVIHTTQGSYSGSVSWFQNAAAGVSAHYTINNHNCGKYASYNRNQPDGQITQSVSDINIAYHVASANTYSIGIEHAAYLDPANSYRVVGSFSTPMYDSSARLTAYVCYAYGIAINRNNIIGHNEDYKIGGTSDHMDPGPSWNWTYYIDLVNRYRAAYENGTIEPPKVELPNF